MLFTGTEPWRLLGPATTLDHPGGPPLALA